jgi:hypothetical protein
MIEEIDLIPISLRFIATHHTKLHAKGKFKGALDHRHGHN